MIVGLSEWARVGILERAAVLLERLSWERPGGPGGYGGALFLVSYEYERLSRQAADRALRRMIRAGKAAMRAAGWVRSAPDGVMLLHGRAKPAIRGGHACESALGAFGDHPDPDVRRAAALVSEVDPAAGDGPVYDWAAAARARAAGTGDSYQAGDYISDSGVNCDGVRRATVSVCL